LLAGRRIDRVWRPGEDLLLLDVGALNPDGPRQRLLIDVTPRHPRVVLSERWPETPKAPDRETLLFRAQIENRKVIAVTAQDERRLVFQLFPGDDALVVQLAGRYPNVCVRAADGTAMARLHADRPPFDPDSPPLPEGPEAFGELVDAPLQWHAALAAATWAEADQRQLEADRAALTRMVRAHAERQRRTAARLEAQLAEADGAEGVRRQGELLKTVLRQVVPKATEVLATDWYADPPTEVRIALDPKLDAATNLERIFARYRKLVRTRHEAEERLIPLWDELARLDMLAKILAIASTPEDIQEAASQARSMGIREGRQQARGAERATHDGPRLPYRVFHAADGTELWLGRSAADNDAMTFRHARGHDLFLHAHDVAGSHVILRVAGRTTEPGHEALLDAATLAAFHSKARHEGLVTVMYTQRKHVRKGRGMAPGRVTVAAIRTLAVRIDQDRIDRLYRSAAEA
jgi:predicted ribosome quality control (RQC) complex YloA/Tae2 family protein